MKTPAIILSAGESKRMGSPKALLRAGKRTLLEDQIRRLKMAGCAPIVVVIGAHPVIADVKEFAANLYRTRFVTNRNWRMGQFSSIKCGLGSLKNLSRGCIIMPIDCPFVPASVVKRVLRAASAEEPTAVIPVFFKQATKRGHPIWIGRRMIKKALAADSKNARMDRLLDDCAEIIYVKTRSKAVLNNVNTIRDWLRVKI